jgi:hypothetical protein
VKRRALGKPFVVILATQGCAGHPTLHACSRDPGPTAPAPAASSAAIDVAPAPSAKIVTEPSAAPSASTSTAPSAATTAPKSTAPRLEDYPDVVNAKDGPRTVFRGYQGMKCFVELPWPPGKPRMPGEALPTQDVPCPPKMKTAAWEKCRGGTILAKKDGSECICFVWGNPPPLPEVVGCP